jgi:hypothetical protein
MPSLNTLANRARNADSAGGERVYLTEARAMVAEANADGRITTGERDILERVVGEGNLTRSAVKLLNAEIARGPSSSSNTTAPAASDLGDDIGVNDDGRPTVNGRATNKAWIECADALADVWESGSKSFLKRMPLNTKKALLENAVDMLENPKGRSAADKRQMRSSAFSIAFAVATSLPKSRATSGLLNKAQDALMDAAKAETHPRLAKHMTRLLCDKGYMKTLSSSEKKAVKKQFEAQFPQKFDVSNMLDSDGYIQWEHSVDDGENMFRSFLLNVRQTKIGGANFKILEKTDDSAELEVTFRRGRGEDGRVKGIRLKVKTFDNDMFDSLGKPVGISYGGHSDTGNNQERSLARALKNGDIADNPQFVYLDLCAGLDGLDDGLEQLGNVELLTTLDSSLYTHGKLKDEDGRFKGIDTSEMQPVIFQIWEGLSREENYGKMRSRVKGVLNSDDHPYNPNYIFGTEKDYRDVRWAHLDGDDDGVADALDLHYRFGLKDPRKSVNFKLKHKYDANEINGDTVRDAALDLNVSTHYNAFTHYNDAVVHNFTSGGFFDGKGSDELVRFESNRNTNGKKIIEVKVNSGLGHTSREALGALVHYEAMLNMADADVFDESMDESEKKLNALVFAAARLICDGGNNKNDKRIWKAMVKALGFPASMPYTALAARLNKEQHDYTGNAAIARFYKRQLSASQKRALADPTVGRVGTSVNVA